MSKNKEIKVLWICKACKPDFCKIIRTGKINQFFEPRHCNFDEKKPNWEKMKVDCAKGEMLKETLERYL